MVTLEMIIPHYSQITLYKIKKYFMKRTLHNIYLTTAMMTVCLLSFTHRSISQTQPRPDHVIIVMEENYDYGSIYGSSSAPYLNSLISDTDAALFTNFYAIDHPSEPNYLDILSGDNQGVCDDAVHTPPYYTTPNLAAQLIGAGLTFVTYSEDMPIVAYDGASSGNYVRKHNPVTNWSGTGTNQVNENVVNLPFIGYFPASANYSSLPTFSFVMPNQNNDMHNGSISTGDTWARTHMDTLKTWCKAHNSLLIYTFDEDDDLHNNHIFTLFYGPMVKGGSYAEASCSGTLGTSACATGAAGPNLYSLLRTVEDMYGLPYAGAAATSCPITDCWRWLGTPAGVSTVSSETTDFTLAPNPANNTVTIKTTKNNTVSAQVTITDVVGRIAGQYTMTGKELSINTSNFAQGVYFYKVTIDNKTIHQSKFVINH